MINLFKFIEKKKGIPIPLKLKLIYNLPLTKEELYVKGDLDLEDTGIKKLPDNLEVSGYLGLYNNTDITELPDNLTVGDDLELSGTIITKLPKNLKVSKNLLIYNTKIKELPDDLEVDGKIYVPFGNGKYYKTNFPKFKDKIYD